MLSCIFLFNFDFCILILFYVGCFMIINFYFVLSSRDADGTCLNVITYFQSVVFISYILIHLAHIIYNNKAWPLEPDDEPTLLRLCSIVSTEFLEAYLLNILRLVSHSKETKQESTYLRFNTRHVVDPKVVFSLFKPF